MRGAVLLNSLLTVSRLSAARSTAKIDTHAHFLPDFYAQALRDAGHLPGPDGMPGIPEWTPEAHLKFMKDHNVEKSILSISSPGVYLSVPSRIATENATRLARQVNDYASQLKAQYPEKFGFFASVPLPDIQASLAEIEYCFTELDPKPDGVVFMSNAYGMYFGDPALEPVYEALNKLNFTIFEHPTTPCTEDNYSEFSIDGDAPDITQRKWQLLNRPDAIRQGRTPTLDFTFDTVRTFADLFYSRIPTRFSRLRWIIPHAGGALIPTIDRIVQFSDPGLKLTEESMKDTLSESFYFDLAGPWPVTFAIPPLMRWVGHEKLLWGSDTPFTPWDRAGNTTVKFDVDLDEVFEDLDEALGVRKGNAEMLLS